MSREQPFDVRLVILGGCITLVLIGQAAISLWGRTAREPSHVTPQTTTTQYSSPDPLFDCRGDGVEAVVSLGGDGKSVYVYCQDVKP